MSFNGSGTFVINSTGQPVVTGTTIASTAFNALTADLATGLSTTLTKDGQSTPTANLPMGTFKLTGLGNGSASTDSITYGQAAGLYLGTSYTTTATAAGTTTLTVASNINQFFTGVTTQTVVLPVVTTLPALGFQFRIVNLSTGNLTVNSSGGNLVATITANQQVTLTCILLTGTDASSWDVKFSGATSITGTGSTVRATSPTLATPLLGTPTSGVLTNCTGYVPSNLSSTTGSGAAVLASTPTLVTPVLGAATATSIAFGHEPLADYDEVAGTIGLTCNTSGTITLSTAAYKAIRIGNQVTVNINLVVGSVSSPVGTINLTGLPFTCFNADQSGGALTFVVESDFNVTLTTALAGYVNKNATTALICKTDATGGAQKACAADFKAGSGLGITLIYFLV